MHVPYSRHEGRVDVLVNQIVGFHLCSVLLSLSKLLFYGFELDVVEVGLDFEVERMLVVDNEAPDTRVVISVPRCHKQVLREDVLFRLG
jgi:hypothetical protein